MDPELRDALNQVVVDLRGEIRAGDADLRGALEQLTVDLRDEIQTSSTGLVRQMSEQIREQIRDQIRELESRMRRHFDVVAESFHADTRSVGEGTALVSQRADRRFDEQAERSDGLEGRVLGLEVRVKSLEDGRKPRRSRRGR